MASSDFQPISRRELIEQLYALGLRRGGVLLVYTSYRAVRPVEGGPEVLIAALRDALGPDGTLVMPSWTGDDDAVFDPSVTPAAPDLGIVAEMFRRMQGTRRADHPFAFTAAGPMATQILADPLPLPPHIAESPVGRVHEADGQVMLLGVGHDANTTLHLAECVAAVPYGIARHCTVARDGAATRIDYLENDHCCARFALADDWLRAGGLQAEGKVGHSHARLMRARDVVNLALERLETDPLIFLHAPEAGCVECDRARVSIPV